MNYFRAHVIDGHQYGLRDSDGKVHPVNLSAYSRHPEPAKRAAETAERLGEKLVRRAITVSEWEDVPT